MVHMLLTSILSPLKMHVLIFDILVSENGKIDLSHSDFFLSATMLPMQRDLLIL